MQFSGEVGGEEGGGEEMTAPPDGDELESQTWSAARGEGPRTPAAPGGKPGRPERAVRGSGAVGSV